MNKKIKSKMAIKQHTGWYASLGQAVWNIFSTQNTHDLITSRAAIPELKNTQEAPWMQR